MTDYQLSPEIDCQQGVTEHYNVHIKFGQARSTKSLGGIRNYKTEVDNTLRNNVSAVKG